MGTQNAEKLKQNLQKTTLFEKKNAIFSLRKSPSWSDLFLNPLTLTSPAREVLFSARNRIPFTCFGRFFRGSSPHPSVQMLRGKFFFVILKARFLASNRGKLERRARARACCSGGVFFLIYPLKRIRGKNYARPLKRTGLRGNVF